MSFVKAGVSDLFGVPRNCRLEALPPFLRVLLTTDGTVTKSLESYFWEGVNVEPKEQAFITLAEHVAALDCAKGTRVLLRKVELCGADSRVLYASAESLIRCDLLPEHFQRDLNAQKLGVGELLRECELETYREILTIGEDRQADEVWRLYRIILGHRPFIQINEHFPIAPYRV